MATVPHSPVYSASDLLLRSSNGFNGNPLQTLGTARFGLQKRNFVVAARLRKGKRHERPWPENPDPNVKGGILTHLSHFKPLKEKPKPVILNFEKPLIDLEKKIDDVRKMAAETTLDFDEQIAALESKYHNALEQMYTSLQPIQRVYIARHPNRPTFLDHVFSITEKFVELHGDRAGYDDPAMVTGLGTIDGKSYMFIGQQKGRNTKENVKRNFGMPTPHGYRKALRMMYYADQHGFPIITFVDTPGAFADLKSEHIGQGEAIAHNLREMFGLKVPIISIIIGEGGSGGALAIACGNKLLMLENAVLYVASPEACAAILWKTTKAIPEAAKKLKITAHELCKLKIADGVIPEPLGGAHTDPSLTSQRIKNAINEAMAELEQMDTQELLKHRLLKFRNMGRFQEGKPVAPARKRNMKKIEVHSVTDLGKDVEKLRQHIAKAKESSRKPSAVALNKMINRLKKGVEYEYAQAFEALGFKDRVSSLQGQITESVPQGQPTHPVPMEKMTKLEEEFNARLSAAPNYSNLKYKLDLLKEFSLVKSSLEKDPKGKWSRAIKEKIKEVLNQPDMKEKMEIFGAEVQKLRRTGDGDLDEGTKENMKKMKKEIDLQIANRLKSVGLDVTSVNPRAREFIKRTLSLHFKAKTGILREKFNKKIGSVKNSAKTRRLINLLKSEVEKAQKAPNKLRSRRIKALRQIIEWKLAGSMKSRLKQKDKHLIVKVPSPIENTAGLNGSLRNDDSLEDGTKHEESRVEVNLGA